MLFFFCSIINLNLNEEIGIYILFNFLKVDTKMIKYVFKLMIRNLNRFLLIIVIITIVINNNNCHIIIIIIIRFKDFSFMNKFMLYSLVYYHYWSIYIHIY